MTVNKFRQFIYYFGWLLFICVIIWLLASDLGRSGYFYAAQEAAASNPIIGPLFPADRVMISEGVWQIHKEPLYFSARLPRPYDRVQVKLLYDNTCCQDIKIGLQQASANDWAYHLETLDNRDFNNLSWPNLVEGETILWQRNIDFSSIAEFIGQAAELDRVASYNIHLPQHYILPDYKDWSSPKTRNYILRGDYSFYTYSGGDLDFTFFLQDLNRSNNEDNVLINVYDWNNNRIVTKALADDGWQQATDPASNVRQLGIALDHLQPGVYRFEVLANYDIFTTAIRSPQIYLTFIKHLYLAGNSEYADGLGVIQDAPIRLISNSSVINISTSHPSGKQNIMVAGRSLAISELHKIYTLDYLKGQYNIDIDQSDLMIDGNNLFAFADDEWFAPSDYKTTIVNDESPYDYFIAKYQLPVKQFIEQEQWFSNVVVFNLDSAALSGGKLRFMIAAPGVSLEQPFKIKKIELSFSRTVAAWWPDSLSYLKYWWQQR
ncbi:MAG: hypothetical protein ACKKL5_02290 [Candidatus Komeilibacteria bacterium]